LANRRSVRHAAGVAASAAAAEEGIAGRHTHAVAFAFAVGARPAVASFFTQLDDAVVGGACGRRLDGVEIGPRLRRTRRVVEDLVAACYRDRERDPPHESFHGRTPVIVSPPPFVAT
jgi:hypothetical protein